MKNQEKKRREPQGRQDNQTINQNQSLNLSKKRKRTKRGGWSYVLLIMVFVAGLGVMGYPTISDYWNSLHQTRAIMNYAEAVTDMDEAEYEGLFQAAQVYNAGILNRSNRFLLSEEEHAEYESLLNVGGSGVMGYVEIPIINVYLPIYHGTEESVLQTAVGHLEWTSLPVGGEGTHTVLSGHRGLPSAKLFTDLDKLVVGDVFLLGILNEVLTYEIDQILIVVPEDITALQISDGMDYCTLVTCTPYGINTHRLLVRGHRIENEEEARTIRVPSEAVQVEPVIVAPVVAIPILGVAITLQFIDDRRRRRARLGDEDDQYGV